MALLGLSGLLGLAAITCLSWNLWGTLRGSTADRARGKSIPLASPQRGEGLADGDSL